MQQLPNQNQGNGFVPPYPYYPAPMQQPYAQGCPVPPGYPNAPAQGGSVPPGYGGPQYYVQAPPPYAGYPYAPGMPPPPPRPPKKAQDPVKKERRRKIAVFSSLAVIVLCVAAVLFNVLLRPQSISTMPNQFDGDAPAIRISELPESTDNGLSTVDIVAQVGPSVVSLDVYLDGSLLPAAAGSGVIFSNDGYILTNAHVLEGATGVQAILADDRKFTAKIVGADPRTDLAVVRIDAPDLQAANFGDSTLLQVGERTIVIGNAAGIPGSVTQGIVSGLGRRVPNANGSAEFNLIQTDAAINPGNSGGALINRFGQVVGVTSSKLATTLIEGICFAIPMEEVQPVVENLILYGYVKDRAVLGVTVVALNEITGPANGLPTQGLYLETIDATSDLLRHDVTQGDIILKADGLVLYETSDLTELLKGCKPGDTLELEIQKQGSGSVVTVQALLSESPR